MGHRRLAVLGAALALAAAGCGRIDRSSVATDGTQPGERSLRPTISADGQVVAFMSEASNLVPGDTDGHVDVFVHDYATGETVRASTVGGGEQTLYPTAGYSLSPDGRYVAFEALLGELIPGTGPPAALRPWVGVHDRLTGRTEAAVSPTAERLAVQAPQYLDSGELSLVETTVDGPTSVTARVTPSGPCRVESVVSGDGHACVASAGTGAGSGASGLPGGPGLLTQTAGSGRVPTVLDRELTIDGEVPDREPNGDPAVSRTGRFVAFASAATNHVEGDDNGASDVFVVDRDPDGNGTFDEQASLPVERVSVAAGGGSPAGGSFAPAISADGRFVAFQSDAPDLVGGDRGGATDVFRYDRVRRATVRLSSGRGAEADGPSFEPAITPDGTRAAFLSDATNLVAGDTNGVTDVFRWVQAG